jgi:predicted RNase H-like HicB family nuclease
MRLAGRVFKSDGYRAIEVPILDIVTQGHTKKEAFEMIADAIESLVNQRKLRLKFLRVKILISKFVHSK